VPLIIPPHEGIQSISEKTIPSEEAQAGVAV
jgi:hypothetical protein